jgi:uncharacterized protein YkwD
LSTVFYSELNPLKYTSPKKPIFDIMKNKLYRRNKMKKNLFIFFAIVILFVQACSVNESDTAVSVEGGVLIPSIESTSAEIPLVGAAGVNIVVPDLCDTANDLDTIEFATEVIRLVNVERAKAKLIALTEQSQLTQAAQTHSIDMACNLFLSHTGSDGSSPFQRMVRFGYNYSTAAENVAAGYATPAAVVKGWMASTGHRANIMNKNFTEIGIGYVITSEGPYFHYWTMALGKPK